MQDKLSEQQVDILVGDPAVNGEFSSKVQELNRRLRKNNLDYQMWDGMNDRQHEIFSDNLFLNGECAGSVKDYVHGAVESCGCPHTVEDLHHHSPVLMSKIEAMQNKQGQYNESLSFLDEIVDSQVERLLVEGPASEKIQKSEQEIIDNLAATGIVGSMLTADANSNGPDAEFVIDGQNYWLEIKENTNAQMGDGSITYFPGNPDGERFVPSDPKKFGDDGWTVTHAALKAKEEDILAWLTALIDPARPASSKWRDEDGSLIPGVRATGTFQTTFRAYEAAQQAGLQNKASAGFGLLPPVVAPPSYIDKIYASKKSPIYYIQIGGKGLYWLDGNPANLPIPHFDGVIGVELRPRPSGRAKLINKETGEKTYKTWSSPVDPEDRVMHYSGAYMASARFKSHDVEPSPYTLEEVEGPRGIKAMLAAMQGREDQVLDEPEESEDS
jgi:hypothetical protein